VIDETILQFSSLFAKLSLRAKYLGVFFVSGALSIFGWGHHFQTIQSMPSNMPQM
jgi:hypothetical protein